MLPLGILVTGDPVPPTRQERGDFAHLLREGVGGAWQGSWLVTDCRRGQPLPDPGSLAGLIVTGSPSSVMEAEAWMLEGQRYLRAVVVSGLPVLGVCFGHQLLAQALGGRVEQNPRGREIGTYELAVLDNDPVLDGGERPYEVNMSHVDSVVEPPPGARVLARTEREPHAALRFAVNAWGVQFHPEFDRQIVGHYTRTRSEALREEGLDPEHLANRASDAHAGAGVLRRFVSVAVLARSGVDGGPGLR